MSVFNGYNSRVGCGCLALTMVNISDFMEPNYGIFIKFTFKCVDVFRGVSELAIIIISSSSSISRPY